MDDSFSSIKYITRFYLTKRHCLLIGKYVNTNLGSITRWIQINAVKIAQSLKNKTLLIFFSWHSVDSIKNFMKAARLYIKWVICWFITNKKCKIVSKLLYKSVSDPNIPTSLLYISYNVPTPCYLDPSSCSYIYNRKLTF